MGQRIRLTAVTLADAKHVNRWKNDPEIQKHSSDSFVSESLLETEARVARWRDADPNQIVHFAIRALPSDELLGFCHLAEIDRANRRCKVGLVIGERALWGQGCGSAAVSELLEHATRRGLTRVVAEVYGDNLRSQRLFAKLGFELEGTQRASVLRGGHWIDELIYAWRAAER